MLLSFRFTNGSFHYCTDEHASYWHYRGSLSRVKPIFHLRSSDISPPPNISQSLLTEGNERNITFHCQQGVAMTTGHRCHRKWVTLVELHWLWYPRILLFSSQTAAGPLSPCVHLPFCREQKEKKQVTRFRVRTPRCINPHRSLTSGSVSPVCSGSTMARSAGSQSWTKPAFNKGNLQAGQASLQGANH